MSQFSGRSTPEAAAIQRMEFQLLLRRRGIADPMVLRALDEVPRERFVEESVIEHAYADSALPIACGQTISQPYVVALMTQMLQVQPEDRVLEIGTGSGYQAAVLARLAREVVSIERWRTLAQTAGQLLAALGIGNVMVLHGDGASGHAAGAPYDRIMVTCAVEHVPEALVEQLTEGGRLVAPVGGRSASQVLTSFRRQDARLLVEHSGVRVRFVPFIAGLARSL